MSASNKIRVMILDHSSHRSIVLSARIACRPLLFCLSGLHNKFFSEVNLYTKSLMLIRLSFMKIVQGFSARAFSSQEVIL